MAVPSQRESDTVSDSLARKATGKDKIQFLSRFRWMSVPLKRVYVFCCLAAVSMKADGFQVPAGVKKALAPAVAALSIAAPAFAEGTGEVICFLRWQSALFL